MITLNISLNYGLYLHLDVVLGFQAFISENKFFFFMYNIIFVAFQDIGKNDFRYQSICFPVGIYAHTLHLLCFDACMVNR